MDRAGDGAAERERMEALMERIAAEVHRRGLETLAIFLLEANKPLAFVYGQAIHAVTPAAAAFADLLPFLREENLYMLARILEREETVERLIRRIEEMAAG